MNNNFFDNLTENLHGAKKVSLAFMLLITLYIALSFIIIGILSAVANTTGAWFYYLSAVFSPIAIFITLVVFSRGNFRIMPKTLNFTKTRARYCLLAPFLCAGMFLCFGFLNGIIKIGAENAGLKVSSSSVPLGSPIQLILSVIFLAVLPAFAEESFFRGFFLADTKNVLAGVIISALCFSLYHGSITQLAYQFLYGISLAVFTVKSKSVLPAMLAHFLNNLAVITLSYFNVDINLRSIWVILIGAAILATFFALLFLLGKSKEPSEKPERGFVKNFFLPFGAAACIICVAMVVLGALTI